MTNALEKSRTELVVEAMDYNVGLKETRLQPPRARAGPGQVTVKWPVK